MLHLRSILSRLVLATVLCFGQSANAAIIHFIVPVDGFQEIGTEGDLDGTGVANLYINNVNLTIDWDISVNNILLPLNGAHIHQAVAGANGPIVVNFSSQLTGTNLFDADLANVLANPSDFYVNLHNAVHPAGALRGQLGAGVVIPEPATLGLLGLGVSILALWRRRTHSAA